MPLGARLGFVARFGPVVGTDEEILRAVHLPFELGEARHHHHRPADVDRVIGTEAELAARLDLGGEQSDRAGIHEAPLGVACLGPGIGVEQPAAIEAGVRQALEHLDRVAHVQADVGQPAVADVHQRADDAVEERFAADEAHVGCHRRLLRHMLALAKADLDRERSILTEQPRRIERAVGGDLDRRQQLVDQPGLSGAQRMALPAAIEPADRQRIGHVRALSGCAHALHPSERLAERLVDPA